MPSPLEPVPDAAQPNQMCEKCWTLPKPEGPFKLATILSDNARQLQALVWQNEAKNINKFKGRSCRLGKLAVGLIDEKRRRSGVRRKDERSVESRESSLQYRSGIVSPLFCESLPSVKAHAAARRSNGALGQALDFTHFQASAI